MAEFFIDGKTLYPNKGKGFKWTVKALEAITSEYDSYDLSDSDGLSGRVSALKSGKISIYFRYPFKWEGNQYWFSCGTFPKLDLSKIRENRDWAKQQIALGINPCLEKKAKSIRHKQEQQNVIQLDEKEKARSLTFNDMFQDWLQHGVERQNDNQTLKDSFNRHVIPIVGDIKVCELTPQTLRHIFEKIKATATNTQPKDRTVQKTHGEMQQLFEWALGINRWQKLLDHQNPLNQVKIRTFTSQNYQDFRERVLSDSEIVELFNCIEKEKSAYQTETNKRNSKKALNPKIEIAIWLCLSTMCRIGELMQAEWNEIDLFKATWVIPVEKMKKTNKSMKAHTVYLSPFALEKFKLLKELAGNSKWCFPSSKNIHEPISSGVYSKVIGDRQIMFKGRTKQSSQRRHDNTLVVGNQDWTLHDLRRTGATLMQQLEVSPDIIDLCQNHEIRTKVRRAYQQYEYSDQKKDAWDKLGAYLESILPKT